MQAQRFLNLSGQNQRFLRPQVVLSESFLYLLFFKTKAVELRLLNFLGVPLRVGLSAISFSAALQKDAAPIPNATGYEQWAASFGQNCSQLIAHSSWPIFNFQLSVFNSKSPERTTVSRQAVKCEARNPCKIK